MKLEEIIPIEINGTFLIIGSVQWVEIDEKLVGSDGFIDLASEKVLVSQGLDAYFTTNLVGRLHYAKV
jgi:hypothetical protein